MRLVILAAGRGLRLREESGGRAKILLDVAGKTILDRAVELAAEIGVTPLVVTRREFAGEIGRFADVRVEDESQDMLDTLYFSRTVLTESFCWMGGDMVFADPGPLRELFARHREQGSAGSFFYCRTDRFKAKVRLSPSLKLKVTREGSHELSAPNFMVQEPELLADMADLPRGDFIQRAIDRGDPILAQEYAAPVFEIDTPADLAAARCFFAREPQALLREPR
jgi:NDP-sugar pyrophosphorylase family protein